MVVDMEDTIKLDRRSFEALAADSRVRILKSLAKRRKTLSELAKELGLSVSTMKEHLDVLVGAGLIIQKDEGRKWKYYELTRKGSSIVEPRAFRVLVLLGFSLLLVLGSGWNFMNSFGGYSSHGYGGEMMAAPARMENMEGAEDSMGIASLEAYGEPEFKDGHLEPPLMAMGEWEEGSAGMEGAGTEGEVSIGVMEAREFPWVEGAILGAAILLLIFSLAYALGGKQRI